MRITPVLAVLVVAIPASILSAEPPAASPQPTPTSKPATLTSCIETIRQSTDAAAAASAYAKACVIDRSKPELHDAYMRRMLDLGKPENANYAAQTLTVIQPKNNLAWCVVGYFNARNNKIADAFVAIMRGLETEKDDPGVLANAGQMLAWYEFSLKSLKLPQPAKDAAEAALKDLMDKPAFASAYKGLKDACDREKQRRDDLNTKLTAANTELTKVQGDLKLADQEVRDDQATVQDKQNILNAAQAAVNDRDTLGRRRALLQAQRELDQARSVLNVARNGLTKANAAFVAQKRVVDGLQKQLNQRFDPGFKWQPPTGHASPTPTTAASRPAASAPGR